MFSHTYIIISNIIVILSFIVFYNELIEYLDIFFLLSIFHEALIDVHAFTGVAVLSETFSDLGQEGCVGLTEDCGTVTVAKRIHTTSTLL